MKVEFTEHCYGWTGKWYTVKANLTLIGTIECDASEGWVFLADKDLYKGFITSQLLCEISYFLDKLNCEIFEESPEHNVTIEDNIVRDNEWLLGYITKQNKLLPYRAIPIEALKQLVPLLTQKETT